MKLLTHNLLSSHVPGLRPGGGFPLRIEAAEVQIRPVPFNASFVSRLLPRLHWDALREAAESPVPNYEDNEDFLRRVHHVLLEVEVQEGALLCPDSGRRFPISRGIPNMLLSEEET